MYEAICAFYIESGAPQEGITGLASMTVHLLYSHSEEFQNLNPDQVRYLRHANNNIDPLKKETLELMIIAVDFQLYNQILL